MHPKHAIISASQILALSLLFAASPAYSQVFVMNRNAFPAADHVDWAVLGNDAIPNDPFSINSSQGHAVNVRDSGLGNQLGTIRQAGIPFNGGTLNGNFAPGQIVLDARDGGTITLSFAQGIFGGGAQLAVPTQTPSGAGPFTGQIQAFGLSHNLLASFTADGAFSSLADNSAPFFGIMDSSPDIYSVSFSGLTPHFSLFLNSFDVFQPAPEPSSLALITLFSLCLASRMLLRRPKTNP